MKKATQSKKIYGEPPFCDCFLSWKDSENKFCTLCGKSYEDYSKLYTNSKKQ